MNVISNKEEFIEKVPRYLVFKEKRNLIFTVNFVSIVFAVKKDELYVETFHRTEKIKQMNKERYYFECQKSLLADRCFLYYFVRNTLAKNSNLVGTETTKWTRTKFCRC